MFVVNNAVIYNMDFKIKVMYIMLLSFFQNFNLKKCLLYHTNI